MTWPEVTRIEPPLIADERALLEAWLDYHRATLLNKCAGLTGEQLVERAIPPSTLCLLGLVRHMAEVEHGWFRQDWQGVLPNVFDYSTDRDADFNDTDPSRADEEKARFLAEVEAARAEAARHQLDDTVTAARHGKVYSLRWIYLHMIEEYARHNGHADLLRERLDGATGE